MPPSSEAVPTALSGSIARSRSRYKGSRTERSFSSTQEPPHLSAAQYQRLRDAAPTHQHEKPNGYVALLEAVAEPESGPRKGPADPGKSNTDAERHRPTYRGSRSIDHGRRENIGNTSRPEDAVQIGHASRELQSLQARELEENRAKLHCEQLEERLADSKPIALTRKGLTQRLVGQTNGKNRSKSREKLKRIISGPIAIQSPQDSIAPAFDAPISAVNAGERSVTVSYGEFTMLLPVTPLTTPIDVIRLANAQIPNPVSPENSILEESYNQLGLERPLRQYEHVRNVMNSWDNDKQNRLVVAQLSTHAYPEGLELHCIPKAQPGDTSIWIYHSQRPGHWDKRWVTLRSDGQILVAKKSGCETSNICHLSDFDIYVPTARQLSKRIRPPRRMCFAIKSQQKSSMFMTTLNFIHFFSTGDKAVATSWYRAVQEWRSWYLVNVMGEGLGKADNYTDGRSSQPGVINYDKSVRSDGQGIERAEGTSRSPAVHHQAARPVSSPRKLMKNIETGAPLTGREGSPMIQTTRNAQQPEPFAATGLLGSTYSTRRKVQQQLEGSQDQGSSPPASFSTTPGSTDCLKRTSSQRARTRPLVDLSPQYREPPQHARKGRGIIPEQVPAGGLVEIATSPDQAIPVPSTTMWQRPGTSSGQDGSTIPRSRTVRRDQSATSTSKRPKSHSPDKGGAPFTGGLLADNSKVQGGTGLGRGVMTGDREAKEPMLDVSEESNYAPGSLLDCAEKHDGGPRPNIRREKWREVKAAVG